MPEWLIKFLGSINIFPFLQRHFLGILLFLSISGWLIFLSPLPLLQFLHIDELRQTHIEIIGATTFISTIGFFFGIVYKYSQNILAYKKKAHEQQKSLNALTPVEYKCIHKFIENRTQTFTFTLYDGVVAGLIEKGILYKANSLANKGGEQDFNIFPWAYEYLLKHPNLFKQGEENGNKP